MAGSGWPSSGRPGSGPDPDAWARLRLSDAERDAAAQELGDHFAAGRLTNGEHAERLDRIWAARTRGEIPPIFGDLPSSYAALIPMHEPRRPAFAGAPAGPRRGRGASAPKIVGGVFLAILVLSHLPLVLVLVAGWVALTWARGRNRSTRRGAVPPWARSYLAPPR